MEPNIIYAFQSPKPPRKEFYLDLCRVTHRGISSDLTIRKRLRFVTFEESDEFQTKFNAGKRRAVDKLRAYGPYKLHTYVRK